MSYFQFAIASIVDANTGHGLVHSGGKIDYAAAASHGRKIRAKSIIALFEVVRGRLAKVIASMRERQQAKRNLRLLAGLNDHVLEDIGITRGDVIAAQLGQIDMRQLETRRSKNRSATQLQRAATSRVAGIRRNALNEAVFAKAKCA
jgi:uncharacterized protein YjiS (DUF1127 family)